MNWQTALKASVAALAAFWGGLEPLLQALIIFMVLDILTGVMAAAAAKTVSSETSYKGMAKKAIVLLLVGAAYTLDANTGLQVAGVQVHLAQVVTGFYVMHEGLSILENAAQAGLPIPKPLKDALLKVGNGVEAVSTHG